MKMMVGQLRTHMKKKETQPLLYFFNLFQLDYTHKCEMQIVKILYANIGENLYDLETSKKVFLNTRRPDYKLKE